MRLQAVLVAVLQAVLVAVMVLRTFGRWDENAWK